MSLKISVCIATYNGEKYILRQLESILLQLGENDEIIISDDYSTDNTLELVKSINDKRINVSYNKRKRGYSHNFENALENASGDIIFLSDQDDVWYEDRVKKMVAKLQTADYVVCDYDIVDGNLKKLKIDSSKKRKGFLNNLIKCTHLGCTIAFNKKVLKKILPFPKNDILCPHDLWIALISQFYFKSEIMNDKLMCYVRHGDNASDGLLAKSENSLFKKIKIRLYCTYHVLKSGLRR